MKWLFNCFFYQKYLYNSSAHLQSNYGQFFLKVAHVSHKIHFADNFSRIYKLSSIFFQCIIWPNFGDTLPSHLLYIYTFFGGGTLQNILESVYGKMWPFSQTRRLWGQGLDEKAWLTVGIPMVFNRVEEIALWRPLEYILSTLIKPNIYGPGLVHRDGHDGTRREVYNCLKCSCVE